MEALASDVCGFVCGFDNYFPHGLDCSAVKCCVGVLDTAGTYESPLQECFTVCLASL